MNIEAFVLIGGKSSRMGRDKAFVEIDGVSLAKRTLGTLKAANLFSKITFVAAHEAQFAIPAIQLVAPFIFDIYPGRGPLSGIHTALADTKSDWIFVTACDYPFTTPKLLILLAEKIADTYGAVVPEQPDGRLQPLFAFYRVGVARSVISKLVEEHKAAPPLRELIRDFSPRLVLTAEYAHLEYHGRLFYNVNEPNDLTIAKECFSKV